MVPRVKIFLKADSGAFVSPSAIMTLGKALAVAWRDARCPGEDASSCLCAVSEIIVTLSKSEPAEWSEYSSRLFKSRRIMSSTGKKDSVVFLLLSSVCIVAFLTGIVAVPGS